MITCLLLKYPVVLAFLILSGGVTEYLGMPISFPLQYGALGLCALMMYYHRKERKELVSGIVRKEEDNRELFRQNLTVLSELREALKDRPCLKNDSRVELDSKIRDKPPG